MGGFNLRKENKNLNWYNISLIAFTSMWSISNIFNNYSQQGTQAIFSWVLIISLYFIPYIWIVSKLGATFPNSSGGVSIWIEETINSKMGYLAAWTYWIVNISYLAQKPQNIIVAISWLFTMQANTLNHLASWEIAIISLVILIFFMWLSARGINTLKIIGSIAGGAMLIISMLLIVLSLATFFIFHVKPATSNLTSVSSFIPRFNTTYFTTLSMFVFAVGGSEKISPYINYLKNGKNEFPKSMLFLAILVGASAILGTYSLGILFNSHAIPKDLIMNGAYVAFQILGEKFHIGNSLMILYAFSNLLAQIAALMISIDAPLKILLSENNKKYIPHSLMKKNKHNISINGYILTGILTSILIIIPTIKIKNATNFYYWLLNLNSVVIPFKFLFIFLAFIFLIKHQKISFTKKFPQIMLGTWIFIITLIISILGMIPKNNIPYHSSQWWFQLSINISTPIIFAILGIILPIIKKLKNHQ